MLKLSNFVAFTNYSITIRAFTSLNVLLMSLKPNTTYQLELEVLNPEGKGPASPTHVFTRAEDNDK